MAMATFYVQRQLQRQSHHCSATPPEHLADRFTVPEGWRPVLPQGQDGDPRRLPRAQEVTGRRWRCALQLSVRRSPLPRGENTSVPDASPLSQLVQPASPGGWRARQLRRGCDGASAGWRRRRADHAPDGGEDGQEGRRRRSPLTERLLHDAETRTPMCDARAPLVPGQTTDTHHSRVCSMPCVWVSRAPLEATR